MKKDTLLIYSGGLDSTGALYTFKHNIGLAISFNYGSRHNDKEIALAKKNCDKLGIEHRVINLVDVFKDFKSALLGSQDIPHGHYAEDNMAVTVVPFRNAIMLSIATGIAESYGLSAVMLASHKGDNAQYPDCTPLFNLHMNSAIKAGTANKVEMWAPFAELDKREIAEKAVSLGMNPADTYSCYEGGDTHCGKCGTCVERIWALRHVIDNTVYSEGIDYAVNVLKEAGEWK